MDGYDATTYGERWADVYDAWYDDPAETDEIVAFLAELAGPPSAPGGPIVELGIGTGRLALPLAARGYDIRGIDASAAMVAKLRAKPGGERLAVTIGDMATVDIPGPVGPARGVYVAANTFFGLATEDEQRGCLQRVHDVLAPGGWLVIAAFIPDATVRDGTGSNVGVRSMTADHVVLTADRYDASNQTISGQYIDISSSGITLRPFHIRYLLPEQLDALAEAADLHLVHRYRSWRREAFDGDSTMHISVYRR